MDKIDNIISDEEIAELAKLHRIIKDYYIKAESSLFEREELIRLIVLTILTKEHLFMYGPPGAAKSVVAEALKKLTSDRPFFHYLMTDFTQYDAIFGKEVVLTQGAMATRVLDKKLPTAYYGFLDEIFKGNDMILNALLTILNEREFDDDYNGRIHVPLCSILAASNEFPRTSYLKALFERFIFRIPVPNIKNKNNRIDLANDDIADLRDYAFEVISEESINFVKKNYKKIKITPEQGEVFNNIIDILHDLMNPDNQEGKIESLYEISGRTIRKIGSIVRMSAYVNMREATDISDFLLLRYIVWNNLQERQMVLPKINQVLFGGESEFHGDTTRELEIISEPTIRYLTGIRQTIQGGAIINSETEFKNFHFMLGEFLRRYKNIIKGLDAIRTRLFECKEKEILVEKNIFLNANKVLDWRVDTSLIKVNSEKFIDLSKMHFVQEFFYEISIEKYDGKRYFFMKLIEKMFSLHEFIVEEMKKWLDENDSFLTYRLKQKAIS